MTQIEEKSFEEMKNKEMGTNGINSDKNNIGEQVNQKGDKNKTIEEIKKESKNEEEIEEEAEEEEEEDDQEEIENKEKEKIFKKEAERENNQMNESNKEEINKEKEFKDEDIKNEKNDIIKTEIDEDNKEKEEKKEIDKEEIEEKKEKKEKKEKDALREMINEENNIDIIQKEKEESQSEIKKEDDKSDKEIKEEKKEEKEEKDNEQMQVKCEDKINNENGKDNLKNINNSDGNEQKIDSQQGEEIKEEKIIINNNEKEEETSERPHYVFYFLPFKRPNNSENNTLDSITYFNGKTRPNYKFFCSFGTSNSSKNDTKNNYNKTINQNLNAPIGIASTSLKSPKKHIINIVPPRTAQKTTKYTNIFKPVPKAILLTTKIETRYQAKIDYRQNTKIKNLKNFSINRSNQLNDKPKLKYYARCPHCNFPLNDEEEVKKYYKNIKYSINSYNANNKKNQRIMPYDIKNSLKNQNKFGESKFNRRNENNNINNSYQQNFYSPRKTQNSEKFFLRSSAQSSANTSNRNRLQM